MVDIEFYEEHFGTLVLVMPKKFGAIDKKRFWCFGFGARIQPVIIIFGSPETNLLYFSENSEMRVS